MSDISRIKGILRVNNLHEEHCAYREDEREKSMLLIMGKSPPCDCWLSEDLFDMEADQPYEYECGTCGSREVILGSVFDKVPRRYIWDIRCGTGHRLIPGAGIEIRIRFLAVRK